LFAFDRFLDERFQTPRGLLAFLSAYNAPLPNAAAVEKWFQRKTVPSEWFAVLLAYLELEEGCPLSITAFLEVRG
jgi:hypothetical protein